VDLDRLILDAYGWSDLDLGHAFQATDDGERFTINDTIRIELLDRLLELNRARFGEEEAFGLNSPLRSGKHKTSTSGLPVGRDLRLL
jgi:hypothetical protein